MTEDAWWFICWVLFVALRVWNTWNRRVHAFLYVHMGHCHSYTFITWRSLPHCLTCQDPPSETGSIELFYQAPWLDTWPHIVNWLILLSGPLISIILINHKGKHGIDWWFDSCSFNRYNFSSSRGLGRNIGHNELNPLSKSAMDRFCSETFEVGIHWGIFVEISTWLLDDSSSLFNFSSIEKFSSSNQDLLKSNNMAFPLEKTIPPEKSSLCYCDPQEMLLMGLLFKNLAEHAISEK